MKKVWITCSLAALLLLSGCTDRQMMGTYMGGTMGGILGSSIGGLMGGPRGSDAGTGIPACGSQANDNAPLGAAVKIPKPGKRYPAPFCAAWRRSKTKRSMAPAASISPNPCSLSRPRNTPSSRLNSSEKSIRRSGSFTMKAPNCGTTSRLCVCK